MAAVPRFREVPDLAALKAEVAALASATGLRSTVFHEADHVDPFGEWVTSASAVTGVASPAGSPAVMDDPWRT